MIMEVTSEDLLARVAEQDGAALSELYDRYAPRVYGLMAHILPTRSDAEGVLQEVFVRLWSESPRLRHEGGSVAAWLVVTARDLAVERLRAVRNRAPTVQFDPAITNRAKESAADARKSKTRALLFAEKLSERKSETPTLRPATMAGVAERGGASFCLLAPTQGNHLD